MKTQINKTEIGIWLPKKLFYSLKEKIDEYNQLGKNPRLNFNKAAYLLNLLFYIPMKKKDKYENGWVPICSTPYKNLKYFNHYMTFLKDSKFISENKLNYSTESKKCKTYKLFGRYGKQVLAYHIVSDKSHFINTINKLKSAKMKTADEKCIHLTKWLQPKSLSIEYNEAKENTRKNYIGESNIRRKNKRLYVIEAIDNKYWSYSREGQDDRLHTILTSLPKDLRSFIKYNNEELISLDIKNSQPFIYSSLLNQLIKPNKDLELVSNNINNEYYKLYAFTMSDLLTNELNKKELQSFIYEVIDGTFYDKYGEILYNEQLISVDINNQCYLTPNVEMNKTPFDIKKIFDSKRSVAKYIILKTLFSSENYHQTIIKVFEKYYPEVYRITQLIKKYRAKNFFPLLLQNIEANFLLDYCTKKIAEKYPEMPLLTIHDSIITTSQFEIILEKEFETHLKMYFGLQPTLSTEPWKIDLSSAS